jgi:16S rRNA (guanine1207-N2)-methyltransferase
MFTEIFNGTELSFETAETLFSPQSIDKGTLAMLEAVRFSSGDKVLDLDCGYGAAGIYAAKLVGAENVVMCDVSEEAVALARRNAALNNVSGVKVVHSDGFRSVNDSGFTLILSNPPYHTDFSVPKHFIEKGFNRLKIGGKMYMVTKRRDWYKNKLAAIFGGVKILEINDYYVFCAEKRSASYGKKVKT